MTDEELKTLLAGFYEGKTLAKEDLTKLMPFQPWSTYDTPYFTLDRLKSIVAFRYERMGDLECGPAYHVLKIEEEIRRQRKKAEKAAAKENRPPKPPPTATP